LVGPARHPRPYSACGLRDARTARTHRRSGACPAALRQRCTRGVSGPWINCDYIGSGEQVPPQCTVCNGPTVAVELGEAMVTEVLRHDGFVEPVAPDVHLATHDGIGALLRHL